MYHQNLIPCLTQMHEVDFGQLKNSEKSEIIHFFIEI